MRVSGNKHKHKRIIVNSRTHTKTIYNKSQFKSVIKEIQMVNKIKPEGLLYLTQIFWLNSLISQLNEICWWFQMATFALYVLYI